MPRTGNTGEPRSKQRDDEIRREKSEGFRREEDSPHMGVIAREVLSTHEEECFVAFSAAMLADVARDLTDALEAVDEEEEAQQAEKAAMKDRLAQAHEKVRALRRTHKRGGAMHATACEVRPDWDAGMARIVRLDTGETIRSRPLTDAERQRKLLPETEARASASMVEHAEP